MNCSRCKKTILYSQAASCYVCACGRRAWPFDSIIKDDLPDAVKSIFGDLKTKPTEK